MKTTQRPYLAGRTLALAATVALASAAAASGAEAQWGSRAGLGYVVNAPNQYVGLSAHLLTQYMGGLGIYVDGKLTHDSPTGRENFESDWSAQYVDDTFGDVPISDESAYRSINIALMRPVTPELVVYAGLGYVDRETYVEYLDEERNRGRLGFYWVKDEAISTTAMNVLAGGLFRISRAVSLQFGFETAPKGATVGASYSIPFRR